MGGERQISREEAERLLEIQRAINTVGTRALSLKSQGESPLGVPHDVNIGVLHRRRDEGMFAYNRRAVRICRQAGLSPELVSKRFLKLHSAVEDVNPDLVKELTEGVQMVYERSYDRIPVTQSGLSRRN